MLPQIAHCQNIRNESLDTTETGGRVLTLRNREIPDELRVGIKDTGNISIACQPRECPWKVSYETATGVGEKKNLELQQSFLRINLHFTEGGWLLLVRSGHKITLETLENLGRSEKRIDEILRQLQSQRCKAIIVVRYLLS